MPPRVAHDDLGRVKAHRLVIEQRTIKCGRVIALQVERLVGDQCETGRVGFTKAKARKAFQLLEDRASRGLVDAVAPCALHKAVAQGMHRLVGAAARHGAAQHVRLARREAGRAHRHPDGLLLE